MTNTSFSMLVPRVRSDLLLWIGGFLLAGALWSLLLREQINLLCALLLVVSLLLVAIRDRAYAAILTLGYLTLMGDIRRIVAVASSQPKLDLLLLVGPAVAIVLSFPSFLKLRLKDTLSKAMLGLLIIMVIEIINPQQGGAAVGASGALFYIVPILWFWIGRELGSPRTMERLLYNCIFPLAVAAAIMGLSQTFIGFLPYQQAWINAVANTYTALHLGGTIRAFGFSVSSAEYTTLLSFGAVGSAAAYFGPRRIWIIALPIVIAAVVIASQRGVILKMVFTLAFVWILRKRGQLTSAGVLRLGLLTGLGLIAVFGVASHFAPSSDSGAGKGSAVQNALEHQAAGLAHPLNDRYSTAGIHSTLLLNAIVEGVVDPIGHGLGATTPAYRKFGGDSTASGSEVDFGDMFISLGVVGGVLYLAVIGFTLRYALLYVRTAPRAVGLPIFAILLSSLGLWLIGSMYSTASLLFFIIGGLAYHKGHLPGGQLVTASAQ